MGALERYSSHQTDLKLKRKPKPKDRLGFILQKQWTAFDRVKGPLGPGFESIVIDKFPAWCMNVEDTDIVYLLKANEMKYIKVGFTSDLTSRIKSYMTYYPTVPQILGVLPGGFDREGKVPEILRDYHYGRDKCEWFDLGVEEIKEKLSPVNIAWNPRIYPEEKIKLKPKMPAKIQAPLEKSKPKPKPEPKRFDGIQVLLF